MWLSLPVRVFSPVAYVWCGRACCCGTVARGGVARLDADSLAAPCQVKHWRLASCHRCCLWRCEPGLTTHSLPASPPRFEPSTPSSCVAVAVAAMQLRGHEGSPGHRVRETLFQVPHGCVAVSTGRAAGFRDFECSPQVAVAQGTRLESTRGGRTLAQDAAVRPAKHTPWRRSGEEWFDSEGVDEADDGTPDPTAPASVSGAEKAVRDDARRCMSDPVPVLLELRLVERLRDLIEVGVPSCPLVGVACGTAVVIEPVACVCVSVLLADGSAGRLGAPVCRAPFLLRSPFAQCC